MSSRRPPTRAPSPSGAEVSICQAVPIASNATRRAGPVGARARVTLGRFGLDRLDRLVEAAARERRAGDAAHRDLVDVLADDDIGDAADELALVPLGLLLLRVADHLDAVTTSSSRVTVTVIVSTDSGVAYEPSAV